jgi:hypothetical protein
MALRAVAVVVVCGLSGVGTTALAQSLREYLRARGFTASELQALDRGEAIAKSLGAEIVGANETAEVVVGGAVRVDVPRDAFVTAVRDVRGFRNDGMRGFGVISPTPQPSDFAAVSLPADDLRELRSCKPGDCSVKLPGAAIADLRARVDWRAPDHAEQVNRLAREQLLAAMKAYVREGTAGFLALEDKRSQVSLDQNFRELLQKTPELLAYYPEIHAFMLEFPKRALEGSESVFYWSLNDFGLKPTLTLTHAAGYAPKGTGDAVVLWKQLYASHYFNGSLGVTAYRSEPGASYVAHLDRVRADGLGGAFGGIKRSKMAGAMAGSLKKFLEGTRRNLQARAADR